MSVHIDEKWLRFAQDDWRLAIFLQNETSQFCSAICFHAQQYVEKILKGVLEGAGEIPPRTHDINALVKRLEKLNIRIPLTEDEILLLSSLYIDTRYPPDISLMPNGAPEERDAEIALGAAKKIQNWIHASNEDIV